MGILPGPQRVADGMRRALEAGERAASLATMQQAAYNTITALLLLVVALPTCCALFCGRRSAM
jgi:hypothetical protein